MHPIPPPAPLEMAAYLLALTPNDWITVIVGVIGATGVSIAGVGRWAWGKWEKSKAKELLDAREDHAAQMARLRDDLADTAMQHEECLSRYKAETEDRLRIRAQKDAELARRQEIIDKLRDELAESFKTIAALNLALSHRDETISENHADIRLLKKDVIDLSDAILTIQGDMKPRGK